MSNDSSLRSPLSSFRSPLSSFHSPLSSLPSHFSSFLFHLPNFINITLISAGLTPGILDACPIVFGRIRLSF